MATLTNVAVRYITVYKNAVSERSSWYTSSATGWLGYRDANTKSTIQLRAYLSEPCTSITLKVTPTSTVSSSAVFYFKASPNETDATLDISSNNVTTTAYDVKNSNTKYAWSSVEVTINGNFKAGYIYVYVWANATNQLQFGNDTYPTKITSATSATAYSLSLSQGTGSTIAVSRTSSNLTGTGTLSNGAKLYSGDKLKITFTASTGYNIGTHTVNGSTFTSGNTHTVSGNVTVVSTASKITYTVSYNANGGTGAPSSQNKIYGTTLTLSATKPTRTGYTFQGWGASASDTSVDYAAGASYTANAAITLYAIWKANSITFDYYSNNGTQTKFATWTASASGTWPNNHYNYTNGTYKQTYTGYTGTGYYGTTTTGGTLVGEDEQMASYAAMCEKYGVSTSTATTTIKIYAQWTPNTYTIKFNPNGGTGTMANMSVSYDTTKKLTSNSFTRSGYAFSGWDTASTGTTVVYTDGQSILNLTTINGATINLYAVWVSKGVVYIADGTGFNPYTVYIHNGSTWEQYIPYIHNGTEWELYG